MSTKTFPITACLPAIYSGGSGVNAGDLHMPIGEWSAGLTGWNTRALLKASLSFAGMTSITAARLYYYQHTAAGWHAKGSGFVTVGTRRKTSDWSEASGGSSTATDEIWGGDSGSLVSGGYVNDGDILGNVNNAAADGTLTYVVITELVRAWFEGAPVYGIMLYATGAASADACELYSRRQSGRVPYIWIDYETNQAPTAPTGLSPGGDATIHTGRTIVYSGTRNDPDGQYDGMTAGEIRIRGGGSSDIDGWTWTQGAVTTFSQTRTLPSGWNADRDYQWSARTKDEAGLWGPWSSWANFRPNTVPSTPPAPAVEADTLTPTITGTFADVDPGNTPSRSQVEVERVTAPAADVWTSGELVISTTPWSTLYAGTALAWSTQYRARIRVRDNLGGWSAWSAWTTWTTAQPAGPDNLTPRTTTAKLNTLTPTLTVGHSAQFRNDDVEVYVGSTTASTKLWTKPTVADYAATLTKAVVYAGPALAWGTTYYWRARTEDLSGVLSAWSALVPFRLNALPTAPQIWIVDDAGVPAVASPTGEAVTTAAQPTIQAPFADPDRITDADAPSARIVELRVKSTGTAVAGYPVTAGVTETHRVTAVLTAGTTYQARVGYRDNAGQPAGSYAYSAWLDLRRSTAPTVALVSPAAGSTITDSTQAVAWSTTPAAGKAQASWRVQLFDRGPTGALYAEENVVHDSGVHAGAGTSYDIPTGIIVDGHSYRWQVDVADSDGLAGKLI